MADFKKVHEEIARSVTSDFLKIEEGVTGGYKKIETAVVGAYKQIENKFTSQFLAHEGESVEEAKARLIEEQTLREEQAQKYVEKRAAGQKRQKDQ